MKKKGFLHYFYTAGIVFFILVVGVNILNLKSVERDLISQKNVLEKRIEQKKVKKNELENKKELINSPEYIEKIARKQFGLVKAGEIIFIEK